MANGAALRAKVDAALRKAGATHRVVKFRKTGRSGGNQRLGLGGTLTVEEITLDPQPTVTMLDAEEVATSGGIYMFGDYKLTISGSVAESVLRTHQILYGDEVLQIVKYRPAGVIQSVVVAWSVIARTVKPGS